MRWKAYLNGHSFDLDSLVELFPEGSVVVGRNEEGVFMDATAFDGMDDASALHAAATDLVQNLNGVARVLDSTFRPVALSGRYEDEAGHTSQVLAVDSVEARSHVSAVTITVDGAEATPPPPPQGALYLELAEKDPNVAEAIRLLAVTHVPGWVELYKLYEIVRDDVAGGQQGLTKLGFLSAADLSAFTGSANRPDVSGAGARHARMPGDAPKRVMSLPEAREVIRHVVQQWLQWRLRPDASP